VTDLGVPRQWVRVSSAGEFVGEQFNGSLEELERHLRRGLDDVRPNFAKSGERSVWLHHRTTSVYCYMVVMEIPWGTYRWIPNPTAGDDG
jgi:hypothetical protein